MAFLYLLIFRFRVNGWLLIMLAIMLFIQPHAWYMRYAPFLWVLPFACLCSFPQVKSPVLWLPISLALVNTAGVFCVFASSQWTLSQSIEETFAPHKDETILLDRTMYEWDGIFDRYNIRQKYANPEETDFGRMRCELGRLSGERTPMGVNISFAEDLVPLPETPLLFTDNAALPWLKMSEGLIPINEFSEASGWRTYANKVKFYMSLDREPRRNWEIILDGLMFQGENAPRELSVLVFVNNQEIGEWKIGENLRTGKFLIPQKLMKESFRDEMRLVTLMLRLPDIPSLADNKGAVSAYGLQLNGMQIRPFEMGEQISSDSDI
jgi:hypothetical protein